MAERMNKTENFVTSGATVSRQRLYEGVSLSTSSIAGSCKLVEFQLLKYTVRINKEYPNKGRELK
jgi:hypothetical protein